MNTPSYLHRLATANVLFVVALGMCVIAYWAGLYGNFLFDDFNNIVFNPTMQAIGTPNQDWLQLALSSDAGVLRRPLSMLSFGLNMAAFGMNPFAFKAVNLAIHLLNGFLFYAIAKRLAALLVPTGNLSIRPEYLGLLAATLWLLHPLNVSGVVYIVQRMNELSALFILAGLLCYVDGRLRALQGELSLVPALIGVCLFGVLAILSKENGALITAFAFGIEIFAFRFESADAQQRRTLKAFFWLTLALPVAAACLWLIVHPAWLSYAGRDFSLFERVLTESRILCDYLLWIFIPVPAWLGFNHDDITLSTGLFHPISTLFALALLLALVLAAWKLRRRSPGLAFGVAWFLIGQSMESTILPLELVFEHRNYLPMAGLLLGNVCATAPWLAAHANTRWSVAIGAALALACAALTAQRTAIWGNPLARALTGVQHHPDSARAQYDAGRNIVIAAGAKDAAIQTQAASRALHYFQRAAVLNKDMIAPATEALMIEARYGPVTRVEVQDLARRLRHVPTYPEAGPFMDLLIAATREKMSLTSADISTLVSAALENSHFPNKVRAMIMLNYGSYLHSAGNVQGAVTWMLAADAQQPGNAYFKLNLAVVAFQTGQLDKARQYLTAARRFDQAGTYAKEIDNLQRQLMK